MRNFLRALCMGVVFVLVGVGCYGINDDGARLKRIIDDGRFGELKGEVTSRDIANKVLVTGKTVVDYMVDKEARKVVRVEQMSNFRKALRVVLSRGGVPNIFLTLEDNAFALLSIEFKIENLKNIFLNGIKQWDEDGESKGVGKTTRKLIVNLLKNRYGTEEKLLKNVRNVDGKTLLHVMVGRNLIWPIEHAIKFVSIISDIRDDNKRTILYDLLDGITYKDSVIKKDLFDDRKKLLKILVNGGVELAHKDTNRQTVEEYGRELIKKLELAKDTYDFLAKQEPVTEENKDRSRGVLMKYWVSNLDEFDKKIANLKEVLALMPVATVEKVENNYKILSGLFVVLMGNALAKDPSDASLLDLLNKSKRFLPADRVKTLETLEKEYKVTAKPEPRKKTKKSLWDILKRKKKE